MRPIHYLRGDIFDSTAQVIVNTVNCKGVMGKGLALAFKERYPDMFAVYQQDCKIGKLRIGRPTIYKKSKPWILNFPTKDHWRFPSKLEYIEKGLEFLVTHYQKVGITSIAFPKLGAQNGKLSWDEVGPIMAKYLSQLDIDVYIYIAEGDKEYQYNPLLDEQIHNCIWKQFSELALSLDRLCEEVGLSKREAQKVVQKREIKEFESQADIDAIEDLAKVSITKIKKYIHLQQLQPMELPGISDLSNHCEQNGEKRKKTQGKKRKNAYSEVKAIENIPLPDIELIS